MIYHKLQVGLPVLEIFTRFANKEPATLLLKNLKQRGVKKQHKLIGHLLGALASSPVFGAALIVRRLANLEGMSETLFSTNQKRVLQLLAGIKQEALCCDKNGRVSLSCRILFEWYAIKIR
jgi:hypothetical protein